MVQGAIAWFRDYRTAVILGPVVWGVLAVAGSIHARLAGLPVLQAIVTWQEWFAALLLLPWLATAGTRMIRPGHGQPDRPALLNMGYVLALIVFGLDLAVRAIFDLGWEPFFVG